MSPQRSENHQVTIQSVSKGYKPALSSVLISLVNKVEVVKTSAEKKVANQTHEESKGAKYNSGCGLYAFGTKLVSVKEEGKC